LAPDSKSFFAVSGSMSVFSPELSSGANLLF
jgi:hypothetical protein